MTTVGYGAVAPLSTYCNLIALAHCWTGTIFIALITSILLLNITRPKYALPSRSKPTSRAPLSASM